MPVAQQTKGKPPVEHGFTPEQAMANLELLLQELEGLEASAAIYFRDFKIPRKDGKGAMWRTWLLPNESIRELGSHPQRVDCVLKHLAWFKEQIKNVDRRQREDANDNLPYSWLD